MYKGNNNSLKFSTVIHSRLPWWTEGVAGTAQELPVCPPCWAPLRSAWRSQPATLSGPPQGLLDP